MATNVTELWAAFNADRQSVAARNRLIEHYMPVVQYTATRVHRNLPDEVDIADLVSVGVFGLIDAMKAFDPARGVKFETYCAPRLRGTMLDELRRLDWVPRLVRSKAAKVDHARHAFEVREGRTPEVEELAAEMELTTPACEALMQEAFPVGTASLDRKFYENDSEKDVRQIDTLRDRLAVDPGEKLKRADLLRAVTKGLNRNERLVVILYYYEQLTMKEIGATLDLSESRVSQMHTAIVERLREQLRDKRLLLAS